LRRDAPWGQEGNPKASAGKTFLVVRGGHHLWLTYGGLGVFLESFPEKKKRHEPTNFLLVVTSVVLLSSEGEKETSRERKGAVDIRRRRRKKKRLSPWRDIIKLISAGCLYKRRGGSATQRGGSIRGSPKKEVDMGKVTQREK